MRLRFTTFLSLAFAVSMCGVFTPRPVHALNFYSAKIKNWSFTCNGTTCSGIGQLEIDYSGSKNLNCKILTLFIEDSQPPASCADFSYDFSVIKDVFHGQNSGPNDCVDMAYLGTAVSKSWMVSSLHVTGYPNGAGACHWAPSDVQTTSVPPTVTTLAGGSQDWDGTMPPNSLNSVVTIETTLPLSH